MSYDKHHQRVVLDTIRRRIESLNEYQVLLDTAAEALGRAAMISESGCRPSTPEPLKSALVELDRLSQAARLACLQATHQQQRAYADQVLVVAGPAERVVLPELGDGGEAAALLQKIATGDPGTLSRD